MAFRGAWKNTNLYYFTPNIENLCKDAAVWGGPQFRDSKGRAGSKPGLEHWRLEQMRAVKWTQVGKLFRGDSYIILNTYEDPDVPGTLTYDLHFWVGEESTEDEYGGAMHKTGELDRILRADGKVGSMHREVQDFESGLFLSYYPEGLTYMDGGVEGVEIEKDEEEEGAAEDEDGVEFAVRLFQVKGRKGHIMLSQVKTARSSMNGGDVFILDAEQAVYQWNGEQSNEDEKARGEVFARSLAGDGDVPREVIVLHQNVDDDAEQGADFWSNFPSLADSKFLGLGSGDMIQSAEDAGDDDEVANVLPILYKMSRTLGGFSSGAFKFVSGGPESDKKTSCLRRRFQLVPSKRGIKPPISDLLDKHIYLVDSGFEINVWLGQHSSADLAIKIFQLAMLYLRRYQRPAVLPIHIYRQGHEPKEWHDFFGPIMLPNKWQRWYAACLRGSICVKCINCVDPDIIDMEDTGTLISDEAAEVKEEPLDLKKDSKRSSWGFKRGSKAAAPTEPIIFINKEEPDDDTRV